MKNERQAGPTEEVGPQLIAELPELRAQLAEANSRVVELEAKCGRLEELLAASEEQIHQLDRLAVVGQLAGGIAHDFGNFLTTSIFYVELLLDDPRLPPELAPAVEAILSGSRRAAQLVRQILDFSRRTTMKTQPVDLASFIDEAAAILRRTLPENIRLVVEVKPGEFVASVDPARVEQVVMNLALNARDAMPDGGELRIGLERMEAGPGENLPEVELSLMEMPAMETPAGKWVCLTVSDTGTGMTENVRTRLFKPFFTTKGEEGTGLGLAQVYGIVRQHAGYIGMDTEVGRGTTFRVYLPACGGEGAGEALRGMSVAPRGSGETILLVEDEERMREVGQRILESLGYRVLAAGDGSEALEMYGTARGIDLVITDMVMPEMGGLELLRELRRMHPHMRALAVTGYALAAREEWAEVGVLGTVRKPFEVHALAEAIRRALDAD